MIRFRFQTALPLIVLFCCQLGRPSVAAAADQANLQPKPGANLLANPDFALGRQFWNLGKARKTVATLDINGDDTPPGDQSAIITVGNIDSWGFLTWCRTALLFEKRRPPIRRPPWSFRSEVGATQ